MAQENILCGPFEKIVNIHWSNVPAELSLGCSLFNCRATYAPALNIHSLDFDAGGFPSFTAYADDLMFVDSLSKVLVPTSPGSGSFYDPASSGALWKFKMDKIKALLTKLNKPAVKMTIHVTAPTPPSSGGPVFYAWGGWQFESVIISSFAMAVSYADQWNAGDQQWDVLAAHRNPNPLPFPTAGAAQAWLDGLDEPGIGSFKPAFGSGVQSGVLLPGVQWGARLSTFRNVPKKHTEISSASASYQRLTDTFNWRTPLTSGNPGPEYTFAADFKSLAVTGP